MTPSRQPMPPRRRTVYVLLGMGTAVVLTVLYFVNPSATPWAPRCIFHTLTGLDCPGCGVQRCLHALLHGHFLTAWRYNPFLLIALPYLALVIAATSVRSPRSGRLARIVTGRTAILTYAGLTIAWWIVRNVWH